MKDPRIAAVLNLSFPGAGYLYAGKRKLLAWGIMVAYVSALVSANLQIGTFFFGTALLHSRGFVSELILAAPSIFAGISFSSLVIGLAIDAYKDAADRVKS